jgi:ribose 5-phosphate isomerase B
VKIFIASDHAGFELKNKLAEYLRSRGHQVKDYGPLNLDLGDDYPLMIKPLAHAVALNEGSMGIAIGMSGQGEAIECNRVRGVRAAVYYGGPTEILTLSRRHNDANVLSLGARFVSLDEAKAAADLWLGTPFSNEERHARRVKELDERP